MHSKYASIIWYSHNYETFFFFFFGKWNYETYISDAYKALTKTLKKNKEFENHHTHEEKSGSS